MIKISLIRSINLIMPTALVLLILWAPDVGYSQAQDALPSTPPIDLADYLAEPIKKGESPGLIAAVIDTNGVRAIGAAGLRRQGSQSAFTVNDLVHIGSNTKAMTATMLATLVEDGTFPNGWKTTIGDVYPKLAKRIHPKYRSVTLSQMVRMESGMPRDAEDWRAYGNQSDIRKRRYTIIRDSLKGAPAGPIGRHLYSNLSYMVAASLAEGLTRKSWETLMEERLFAPLGMTTAGFGPPGTPRKVDQPWGHRLKGRAWAPNRYDNDPSLGPAGTVHLTVADWAKFVALWFRGRTPELLDQGTLDNLAHSRSSSSKYTEGWYYTAGWYVAPRPWARGNTLSHSGTNLNWRSALWIAPNRGVAYLAVANAANFEDGDDTYWTIDSVIGNLIQDGI